MPHNSLKENFKKLIDIINSSTKKQELTLYKEAALKCLQRPREAHHPAGSRGTVFAA
jgi:hypothetical protein